jgi:hypothetical protein
MKIYKLLFLAVLMCIAWSCSQDVADEQPIDNSNERLSSSQFDNSYLGVYKGLFSTNDGLTRGSVVVTLSPTNEAIAQIALSSGEMVELKSSRVKLSANQRIDNLHFSSAGVSSVDATLNFSVEGNGLNPSISNVLFNSKESDILIAKNLSRVPLTPITGTYECTDCASQGIAFPRNRTWNVMSIGAGNNQNFVTQVSFSGRVYTSAAENNSQNGCVPVVNFTVCGIAGSSRVLGNDVTWNGTHVYESSDALACSSVNGNWSAPNYGPGISGTFISDSDCSNPVAVNDLCANSLSIDCDDSATGSTNSATNSDTPNFCAENLFLGADFASGPGVWYSFTTATDQSVTVDTEGSAFDTQLRVFSGSCGALVCVESDDDSGTGLLSLLTFTATANEDYYIFLGGWNNAVGSYQLNTSCMSLRSAMDQNKTNLQANKAKVLEPVEIAKRKAFENGTF